MSEHTRGNSRMRRCRGGSAQIARRGFLRTSVAVLVSGGLSCRPWLSIPPRSQSLRFGIVADCHYADTPTAGTRFYRDSPAKLSECVDVMNAEKVGFLIELGDLKDQGKPPVEQDTLRYLQTIETCLRKFQGPTYHVLGNHDMDSLSKAQFLENVTNTGIETTRNYYSFDSEVIHFIVLDANYNSDGTDYDHGRFSWTDANIPEAQLKWLESDLAATSLPTIVFVHQLLDGSGDHYIKNASEVRPILERSDRVLAVFQGHQHKGAYSLINGIHYYTLNALIEGSAPQHNAFAIVEVHPNFDITVTGYRDTPNRDMERKKEPSGTG